MEPLASMDPSHKADIAWAADIAERVAMDWK
jgi:hypothetical protein